MPSWQLFPPDRAQAFTQLPQNEPFPLEQAPGQIEDMVFHHMVLLVFQKLCRLHAGLTQPLRRFHRFSLRLC